MSFFLIRPSDRHNQKIYNTSIKSFGNKYDYNYDPHA